MKKIILPFLSLFSLLILVGCTPLTKTSQNSESENSTSQSSQKTLTSTSETSTDPELKDLLASYSTFVDTYSDFVDHYKANPNDPDLLNKLSEMTTQETQWVTDSSKYKNQLSGKDLVEYTNISTRLLQAVEKLSQS
ncbi:DUF6591 domain-containing protein [Lactococcus lactis]|uniref:DUF6591 domain-containing protein n=1 Tax=Lactococcus lactis TaxID=1358 RepID=UPI0011BB94A0|nr:DUF6591 domain-containing protein [Lactococcus lactis]QEA61536.1 hypothetical protein FGL73_08600 [Lactococcus lactis]